MTLFWIMTALLTAIAGWLVLAGARRGVGAGEAIETAAASLEMAELDRLKARGQLDEASWTAARAEAGRRILSADRVIAPVRAASADRLWVLAGLVAAAAGSLGLYVVAGTPGLADQAYESRVDQWSTELDALEPMQVAAVVARVVEERPGDHRALTILGAARFEAGDPIGAASAFRRAVALRPDDAQSWARLGESLVRANDGTVDGDAEAAFRQALNRDPDQLGARYYLGEAALTRGDAAAVRALWGPLIAALNAADPRRIDLERRMPAGGAGE